MNLFPFLCFSVLFCALVMVVVGRESRGSRIVPSILIAVEVLLLLHHEGMLDLPLGTNDDFRNAATAIVAIAATVDLMRQAEKTFPLLAVFLSFQQLLISLGVIGGVSL